MRVDIPVGLKLLFGTSLPAAIEEDCTGGLVIEVFDGSDKVGADVVFFHFCQTLRKAFLTSMKTW